MKLLKQILIFDKMQRPIGNRTMLYTKEREYKTLSTSEEQKKQPELNYCPLPIMDSKKQEVSKKQEIHQLVSEYDRLHNQIHQIKQRLQQLGFGPDQ